MRFLTNPLFSRAHKGVREPVPPRPQCFWVFSTPMPTKDQQCVFHTTMCWSVCSGMRGISPHSHSVTTTDTHTHTPLISSGLGSQHSCCCCCCYCCYCCDSFLSRHRYAAPSYITHFTLMEKSTVTRSLLLYDGKHNVLKCLCCICHDSLFISSFTLNRNCIVRDKLISNTLQRYKITVLY